MRRVWAAVLGTAIVAAGMTLAPPAGAALMVGNYSAFVDGRYDFHTWTWGVASCNAPEPLGNCNYISAIAMPIGRVFQWYAKAWLNNGTYTLTIDVPDGLRCGNVYYGTVIPTHDVYTFDAVTLSGKLDSSFDVGCDNAPAGTITYPFRLVRL